MRINIRIRNVSYFLVISGTLLGGVLFALHKESCEQLVNRSVALFKREMQDQEGLISIGGGGNLNGGVNEVNVIFITRSRMNIAEARRVIVTANQRLIEILNTNEALKSYLHGKPLTIDTVSISISSQTETNERPLDGSVAFVFIAKGKIFYMNAELCKFTTIPTINMTDHPLDTSIREYEEGVLMPLFNESYEEALQIVQGDK